jgi:hypothetical protein
VLRSVKATRYVAPFRQGGSLPALVEADDDGLYVVKFRGAAQGPRSLIAEVICGELARALGLRVPEIVTVDFDLLLARSEPDPEIQILLKASAGVNVGLDYLTGAMDFSALVSKPDPLLAATIVWFDAFVSNVDRTNRNPNMLLWHRNLWLIDHGAALYFHYSWEDPLGRAKEGFTRIREHPLLGLVTSEALAEADKMLRTQITDELIATVCALIPESLLDEPAFETPEAHKAAYAEYLRVRRDSADVFMESIRDAAHV